MHFNMPNLMILGALVASVVLVFRSGEQLLVTLKVMA